MLESLRNLRTSELEQLIGVLRAGRLAPPYSGLSVARHITVSGMADQLAADLRRTENLDLSPAAIADIIELVAADRRERENGTEDQVELVWSGPEMNGVTNRDTPVVVRELFLAAKSEVLVAGYAVYQGKTIFRPLAEAMDARANLGATFFLDIQRPHGDTTSPSELVHRFAHRFKTREWPGDRLPEIYYDPRSLDLDTTKKACLHAKCVVVDSQSALISSANFTEAAQERNIEAGVLVRGAHLPGQLYEHLIALRESGLVKRLSMG